MARPRRNSNRRKPSSKRRAAPGGGALMLVDQEPLRQEARRQHEKVLKRLVSAQRSLQRFQEKDLPQFEQWKASQFGEKLTRLRDLAAQVGEKESVVEQVNFLRFYTGQSIRRCYERVMWQRENPEAAAQEERERREEEERQARQQRDAGPERNEASMEDQVREAFDEIFGEIFEEDEFTDDEGDFYDPFTANAANRRAAAEPGTSAKRLYRALALKLHPDHRSETDPQRHRRLDELWHEAQQAYQLGNREDLERIEALLDVEEGGLASESDIGKIERATEHHRSSLRAMERAVRQAREEPAWMFSKKKSKALASLTRSFTREIDFSLDALKQDLAYFEGLLSDWSAKRQGNAKRKRRTSSKKGKEARRPAQADEPRSNHERDVAEQFSFSF